MGGLCTHDEKKQKQDELQCLKPDSDSDEEIEKLRLFLKRNHQTITLDELSNTTIKQMKANLHKMGISTAGKQIMLNDKILEDHTALKFHDIGNNYVLFLRSKEEQPFAEHKVLNIREKRTILRKNSNQIPIGLTQGKDWHLPPPNEHIQNIPSFEVFEVEQEETEDRRVGGEVSPTEPQFSLKARTINDEEIDQGPPRMLKPRAEPERTGNLVEINIKSTMGIHCQVSAHTNSLIQTIHSQIEEVHPLMPTKLQLLLYRGKQLASTNTIEESGLGLGGVIIMMKLDETKFVTVIIKYKGWKTELEIHPSHNALLLKDLLSVRYQIPIALQKLFLNGEQLNDLQRIGPKLKDSNPTIIELVLLEV